MLRHTGPVTDLTPPEDLIALKAAWLAAQHLADTIAAEEPEGDDEVSIPPRTAAEQPRSIRLFSDEQSARLEAARAEVRRLTMEIYRHPWKQSPPGGLRHAAEEALNEKAHARWRA